MLMVAVVMFFAFLRRLRLPQNMADAKAQNIPVLFHRQPFRLFVGDKIYFCNGVEYGASIIALPLFSNLSSVTTGTLEGLNGLALKFVAQGDKTKSLYGQKLNTISMIFIMGSGS